MKHAQILLTLLLTCSAALSLTTSSYAQVETAWVGIYESEYDPTLPEILAVDALGYAYVVGNTGAFTTIKYSLTGDTLWVKRLNAEAGWGDANAVAISSTNDVYVTGIAINESADPHITTVKYASDGDTLWVRSFNDTSVAFSRAWELAVDPNDNVYVTGYIDVPDSGAQIVTLKYSTDGDALWERHLDAANWAIDAGVHVVADGDGNAIVSGTFEGDYWHADYTTIKYSPAGNTLWVRHYNGPSDSIDDASAVAVDGGGNIYVTGLSIGESTSRDYATIKYSPAGDSLWARRYDGPTSQEDWAAAVAVDDMGSVYITGTSTASGSQDFLTIKYTPSGDTSWVRRYSPGRGALALAIDSEGNSFVTGFGNGGFQTIKYGPSGSLLWERNFDNGGAERDRSYAICVHENGSIYVSGVSNPSEVEWDLVTIMYSPLFGDVTCDGTLDLTDVVLLGNHLDGLFDLTGTCGGSVADVDSDGDIDEDDYNLLYDIVAGVGP